MKNQELKQLFTKKTKKTIIKDPQAYRILIKPLITEKAAGMGPLRKYVFAVNVNANKINVSNAINEVYGIRPVKVNIINVQGKKLLEGRLLEKERTGKSCYYLR